MSSNDLVGERVRVSTSGPTIACEVISQAGEEGGEMNYVVKDLHKGHQFTIRESKIDIPEEEFEDTLYIWEDMTDDGWVQKYSDRDRDEVESRRDEEWSTSGAGGNRIREETETI